MTKATQRKWKRANRMMALRYDGVRIAGRYPMAVFNWALEHAFWPRHHTVASLALDGLSIGDLR